MHFGKITFDVDERGEVGLLTRNIKIQASPDAEQSFFGGHIMAMVTSKMYRLRRRAQSHGPEPGRWPAIPSTGIWWATRKGQYIRNAAIHDTYNRCVTVHGTNNLRVENNVTYNTVGHCFFLEDGIEHGNEFVRNLAIQTKCHTTKPCVPTNLAATGESDSRTRIARPSGRMASNPRMCCCPRTTRWRLTGSPIRTTPTATTWPRVPTRTASGCPCRSTRTAQFEGTDDQQGHLAAPHAVPRVQGQRRPLELRRVHVRPEHQRQQHLRRDRQLAYRP